MLSMRWVSKSTSRLPDSISSVFEVSRSIATAVFRPSKAPRSPISSTPPIVAPTPYCRTEETNPNASLVGVWTNTYQSFPDVRRSSDVAAMPTMWFCSLMPAVD